MTINWIKVEDRMPEENTNVWVLVKDHMSNVEIADAYVMNGVFVLTGGSPLLDDKNITHWSHINLPED